MHTKRRLLLLLLLPVLVALATAATATAGTPTMVQQTLHRSFPNFVTCPST